MTNSKQHTDDFHLVRNNNLRKEEVHTDEKQNI